MSNPEDLYTQIDGLSVDENGEVQATESFFEQLKSFLGLSTKQEKNCKTEDGTCYPASDFAVVPDKEKPSTWKLRLSQGSPGNITKSQLGRAAAAFSFGGFRGNRVQLSADEVRKAKARIRREYGKLGVDKESMPDSIKEIEPDSYIWKEADGSYKFLVAYSNNFRDQDNPPEIISKQSHKDNDRAINSGEWPMPEVWLWHYPYSIGQVTTHYYDEKSGFAIAGGEFYKDKSWAAEGIVEAGWRGNSHGMPRKEIKRDENDKTIITRHRTREITFLPTKAAANNLAFHIISKESNGMNENKEIPAHKREEFIAAFGEERVQEMENEVAQRSQQAKEEGAESKEQSQEVPEVQQQPKDADVVAAIQVLTTTMQQLVESNKELTDRVKALEVDDSERLAQKAANIPPASLEAYVKSQLFSKENEVPDKGKGPKETENKQDGSSGLFFNEMGWTEPFSGRLQQ